MFEQNTGRSVRVDSLIYTFKQQLEFGGDKTMDSVSRRVSIGKTNYL